MIKTFQKTVLTKKGKRILIRFPKKGDIDELLRYINDLVDEDTFIPINKKPTRKEEAKYLKERLAAIKNKKGVSLLAVFGNEIVANGGINRKSDKEEHVGELDISVSKGLRGEGLGYSLIKDIIKLGKSFLGLKIIILRVFGNNERAIHLYEKVGFRECGRVPRGVLYRGKYIDRVTMYLDLAK